jgi:geranylgeranyl pyrophosphate synthase
MLTEVFSDSTHISQVFSTVLTNLVFGELIQAKRDMVNHQAALDALAASRAQAISPSSEQEKLRSLILPYDSTNYFESYIAKTYFKTASMISLGCRGIAIIMGFTDIHLQRALFDFGANLGIAFQIHDDILDFTQSEAQLGKPAFNDLKEGIVTAPIIYALLQ